MRKLTILFLLMLSLCIPAFAENGFWLDEDAILPGMGQRSWSRGYAPTECYGAWTATLPIRTDRDVDEITVRLDMENDAVSPFVPQNMEVTVWRNADGIFPVKLAYRLYPDCKNGDYPAKIVISGRNEEIPFVVRIRNGYENTEKPSVGMELMSSDLMVGANGKCSLQITNRSTSLELQNCVLRISESSGDLLPAKSDAISVDDLQPGESRTVPIPIAVSPEAKVSNYQLQAELSFESLRGADSWKEALTVPVGQELRLEHGEIVMGESVVQGGSGGISMELMNMGAGEVKNIRMTLNLGDFVHEQTVLVGNLQPGDSTTGKLSFPTSKAPIGTVDGNLTVRYEDAFGHEEAFASAVSITVEEPLPITPPTDDPETSETAAITWILIGLCAVFAIALVVQGILLRGKLHKLEEDKL